MGKDNSKTLQIQLNKLKSVDEVVDGSTLIIREGSSFSLIHVEKNLRIL